MSESQPERRSWRGAVLHSINPGLLSGIPFRTWMRVLRDNRFDVDVGHLPRMLSITLASLGNSIGVSLRSRIVRAGDLRHEP